MKPNNGEKEAAKILASALGNFSVAAFTLGIFQGDYMGIILGCYYDFLSRKMLYF